MPHSETKTRRARQGGEMPGSGGRGKVESRHTVGLAPSLASRVKRYAESADTSVSKAIAALVRLGLDSQERRKREFFEKLKENLANDDPNLQDRVVDEFRALILGR